jgi:hypothetical protein
MSIRYRLALLLLALLGVVIVFLATSRYGAGLSPDSVGYIGTARNLIRGAGFTNYDGAPTVIWPPLYPALPALTGGITRIDPLKLANLVNALIFGLIVFASGTLTYNHFKTFPPLALAGALAVLASTALFGVAVMAWSEPLFILFVILSLLSIETYLVKQDLRSLMILAVWVAGACLTRYIGVALILWGGVIVLVTAHHSLKKHLFHLAVFALIAALPLGVWLVRNYTISHTLFGDRAASAYTFADNLRLAFKKVLQWYLPAVISGHRPWLILFGLGMLILAGLSLRYGWQAWKARLWPAGPLFLFTIIYASFLLISSTITATDLIDHRLLSPLVVPLTLILFTIVQATSESYQKRFSPRLVEAVLIAGVAIWLVYPIHSTLLQAAGLYPKGDGYASTAWVDSETVQYLFQHPQLSSKCTFYSNDPAGAYIRADLAAQRSPAKTRYHSQQIVNTLASLRGAWPEEANACLVWFNQVSFAFLFSPHELQSIATLTPLAQLADGAVYTISRK